MKKTAIALATMMMSGVALADSAGVYEQFPYGGILMKRMEMTHKMIDKNGDGMVSKDEYMAYKAKDAEKHFAMMDTDDNGVLERWEFDWGMFQELAN